MRQRRLLFDEQKKCRIHGNQITRTIGLKYMCNVGSEGEPQRKGKAKDQKANLGGGEGGEDLAKKPKAQKSNLKGGLWKIDWGGQGGRATKTIAS